MGITPLVIPFLAHELTRTDSSICWRADLEIESKQMNWSVKTNEHDKSAVPDFYFRKWQKASKCVICHKFLGKNDILEFAVSQLVQCVQQWIQYIKNIIWCLVTCSEQIQILLSFFWGTIIANYLSHNKVVTSLKIHLTQRKNTVF